MISQEPQLRSGPPWIMDEMINQQLELPGRIAESGSVELLGEHVKEAQDAGEPIVFCGCGTSEHAARGMAAILHKVQPAAAVQSRDSFEVGLDPPTRGLLVGISHSGETSATLDALQKAGESGARALLVTAAPELAPEGVTAIPVPLYDGSWCHTVAYTSPILTLALATGMKPGSARSVVQLELDARHQRAQDAGTIQDCERLFVVGSGVDEITAAELALKIEEAAHIPCTPLGVEKILHGHLPAATARSGLVLLRYDGSEHDRRDQRGGDVAAACAVLDMASVTLRSDVKTVAAALLTGAVSAQLLTVELATALGINPDLIRREEDLYREVARVAKAG
ncbi:MAG: SIS domain-containing protein [Actinomycetota bacterium]|nr:SIS domain-containing protein [Actinomycetota bacterium]